MLLSSTKAFTVCVTLVCSSYAASGAVSLIAGWDFQGSNTGTVGTVINASPNSPLVYVANDGVQAGGSATPAVLYLDGTNGSSAWTSLSSNPQVTSFSGSNLNTSGTNLSTTTSGTASLALANQSANGFAVVFKLSLTGYQDPSISYATQRSGTGFTGNQWAYSTDGVNFTNVDSPVVPASSFAVVSVDLSSVDALDNASNVYLRYTLTGATAAAGNNRLDNIQITATQIPEPCGLGLLVPALGWAVRRRRRSA